MNIKFNVGATVKITSGKCWLDDSLSSDYSPKEREIGLLGEVVEVVRNAQAFRGEPIYSIRVGGRGNFKHVLLLERYLEVCPEKSMSYEEWKMKQKEINIDAVEAFKALTESVEKERKEEENMNGNIVLMWSQKMKEGYMKTRDEKVSQIKKSDSIFVKKKELEEKMNKAMEAAGLSDIQSMLVFRNTSNSNREEFQAANTICNLISNETKGAMNEIVQKYNAKEKEIDSKKAEIITMIEGCETYEKTIEVLRAYDIVDSKGKLLLPSSFDLE